MEHEVAGRSLYVRLASAVALAVLLTAAFFAPRGRDLSRRFRTGTGYSRESRPVVLDEPKTTKRDATPNDR